MPYEGKLSWSSGPSSTRSSRAWPRRAASSPASASSCASRARSIRTSSTSWKSASTSPTSAAPPPPTSSSSVRQAFLDKEITGDVEVFVKEQLKEQLLADQAGLHFNPNGPTVVMVGGVNGAGKTTSIAKLAKRLKDDGKKVMVAACDTFRAAAVEQLTIWSERLGCDIVKGQQGSDPAAVAHDASEKAQARGFDVLIVDTAGRLHTQAHLMRELEKIRRILTKKIDGRPARGAAGARRHHGPERHHAGRAVQEDDRSVPASSWPSSTARPRAAPSSASSRSSACRSSSSASARRSTTWSRSTRTPTSRRCSSNHRLAPPLGSALNAPRGRRLS